MANDASKGVPHRVKVRPFSNDEKPKKPTGRPRKKPKPKVFEQPENANGVTDKQAISMIRASILKDGIDPQKMMDIVSLCDRMLGNEDREYALTWTTWIKETAQKLHIKTRNEQYGVVYWDCVLSEARHHILDSYLLYLEKNRKPKDKFYQPRRKCFIKIGLVQALQDMIDDKLDILSISLPPSTGKTTIEKFFITGIAGWYPKDYNLFYSHSGDITRMFYDGCLDIMKSDEYTWQEIFLDVSVGGTNAKTEQIQVGGYKPFPSIQTTSVGAKNSGKVRASKYLMCDDLIGGIEEALNKNQLDKLWSIYSVDARQRKTVDVDQKPCKEIHIATRWSVHDVIGRLQKLYEGNDRCKFLAVPDINPKTGKSNFLYDYGALTEEFFRDQQMVMDEISYRCLYKNDPIEREGLLYHEDEIRTYFTLPEREPDAIVGVCDTKTTGTDYMVLPCFYQYGNDYYLVDCVCDDSSDFGVQQRRVADLILRNNMQQVEFESNAGGGRFALEVDKIVRESGGRCNITTKPTETNKETRIIVNSDWIKRNCLFKEKELYVPRSDYGRFMDFLFSYSVAGKNPHDDVVDALANFALNQTRSLRIAKVEAVVNPFRTRFGGFYE